jgi:thiamine biosynthesis lipoprotein
MHRRCRPLLGTFVEMMADREDAIEAAFTAIQKIHRLMSAHEPDSDVSRINRFGHLRSVDVHDWTSRVIERALFWSKRSESAFDVVHAGRAALEKELLPRYADQPRPEAAHWTWLEIQGPSVRLLKPGCIDLGGIAKGFAVDRAIDALRQSGCARGLVNAGGDVRGFGSVTWPISVVDPLSRRPVVEVELLNEALATSAGVPSSSGRLNFDHLGGKGRWVSVTVVTRNACDADALTKIVWARGARGDVLLDEAGAKALAITAAGEIETLGEVAGMAA